MIVTHDLSKQFDDFTAVDGVNLQVEAGEVLALLGPNGAGKTTTVRIMASILRPTRGWARVAGYDAVTQADKVRASVGILTEQHGLYGRMPAEDYLDFFGQIYNLDSDTRRKRIHRLLDDFNLTEDRKRRIGEYSKGMRQKLALARALLHEPPVLLLDEPTSAMDPESAILVRDSIRELRSEERAIIICTHNLAEAEQLADQIAIIRRGKIIAKGPPADLKLNLLGPSEYELCLGTSLDGTDPLMPAGAILSGHGPNWVRYRTAHPEKVNPLVLRDFLDHGIPVVSLFEVPRSLEEVYMRAVSAMENAEVSDVG